MSPELQPTAEAAMLKKLRKPAFKRINNSFFRPLQNRGGRAAGAAGAARAPALSQGNSSESCLCLLCLWASAVLVICLPLLYLAVCPCVMISLLYPYLSTSLTPHLLLSLMSQLRLLPNS